MKHPKYIIVKFIAIVDGEHCHRSISLRYLPAFSMESNVQRARDFTLIEHMVFRIYSVVLNY